MLKRYCVEIRKDIGKRNANVLFALLILVFSVFYFIQCTAIQVRQSHDTNRMVKIVSEQIPRGYNITSI